MTTQEPAVRRNGADEVVEALVELGVDTFFMNPGTSEVHLVSAIDAHPSARPVLCLFEGGATGAADGYARAGGTPAAVLLHLGPGLANGLANLHNARKARSPIVVIVGEHASDHLAFDTPLNSDVESLTGFAAKATFALRPGQDIRATVDVAVRASMTVPTGPVVIVANVDAMWSEVPGAGSPAAGANALAVAEGAALDAFTQALGAGHGDEVALVLGGSALDAGAIGWADRIAQKSGCALYCETFNARHERGAGIPAVARIPYFREIAAERLDRHSTVLLAGSRPPVAFFASPGERSELTAARARLLASPEACDPGRFLEVLGRKLDVDTPVRGAFRQRSALPEGRLNARAVWAALNHLMPAGAMVADEAGVTSVGADEAMAVAEPHVWFNLTGGSIGQAIPLATGAALRHPERSVLAVQGDGGAIYTIQALWTQAREALPVVNIILRNDRYAILDHEVKRHGLPPLGPKGSRMFDLTAPSIDWVGLAMSLGVESAAVDTAEAFSDLLRRALDCRSPFLIEVRLVPGKRKG